MAVSIPRRLKTALKIAGVVAGLLVVALAVFVAVTWAPDRSVADLKERWAAPPSFFIDVRGMQVHVRDEGPRSDELPIVLLHGTSASLHTWDGWAAGLKAERRVIRFDLPAFGLTGPSPDGDYTVPNYVRFVTAMLDALHVQRCVLGGNSFGGQVAWATAREVPDRVAKLILVDAGGYPPTAQSIPIGFRLARIPGVNKLMLVSLPRSIVESSVRDVYGDPSLVTPDLVDRYYELTLREGNRAALPQRLAQAPYGEMAALIPEVKTPTLILWGGRDRLVPPENAEHFRRDIAGSELVIFEQLGHVPHEEDPAHTLEAVKAFLRR